MKWPILNSTHFKRGERLQRRNDQQNQQGHLNQPSPSISNNPQSATSQPQSSHSNFNTIPTPHSQKKQSRNKMTDKIWQVTPLTYNNYESWMRSLETIAMRDEHAFHEHLEKDIELPADASEEEKLKHKIAKRSATFLVEQFISSDIKIQLESNIFAEKTPHEIITIIKKIVSNNPENDPSLIFAEANSLELHAHDDIKEYLTKHSKLRKQLVEARYPGIDQGRLAVDLILNGLKDPHFATIRSFIALKPDIKTSVSECTAFLLEHSKNREQSPDSTRVPAFHTTAPGIKYQQQTQYTHSNPSPSNRMIVNKQTPQPPNHRGPWCSFHASPTHYTNECKAFKEWKGLHWSRQFTLNTRGKQPNKNRHQNKQNVNQMEEVQNEPDTCNNCHHSKEVPSPRSVLIDTCCFPTHLTKPTNNMKPSSLLYTKTATGHRSSASHAGKSAVRFGRIVVPIDRSIVVPNLKEPLISAYQVAKYLDITIKDDKIYVSKKQKTKPENIVASGNAINGMYQLPANILSRSEPTEKVQYHPQHNATRTIPLPRNPKCSTTLPSPAPPHLQRKHRINPSVHKPHDTRAITLVPPPQPPTATTGDYFHYHRLYNHVDLDTLHEMAKRNTPGLPNTLKSPPPAITCSGCASGKMKRSPFMKASPTPLPGENIASDIASWDIKSHNGYNYFTTFIDEATRYLQVIPLTHKSNVTQHIKPSLNKIQLHTGKPIQQFRIDGAKEYTTKNLLEYYDHMSITIKQTTPHTPQENAKAERVNQTLKDRIRSTMAHSNLPPTMWEYALQDTVDKYNETLHHATKTVPAAVWHGRKPDNSNFLPLGQFGFVVDSKNPKKAAQDRSKLAQYLCRYDNNHYVILLSQTHRVTKIRIKDFQTYSPYNDPDTYTMTPIHNQHNLHTPEATPIPTRNETILPPRSRKEAQKSKHRLQWQKAYDEELEKLDNLNAIKWIPKHSIPKTATVVPLMITYRIKCDEQGEIDKFKCRCTVRGDKQIAHEHFNPDELSSAVAGKDAIRVGLSIAAEHNFHVEHIDIESAFLNDILKDTQPVYVKQPPQFDGTYKHPNCVGVLQRNIYGTKNACRIFTTGVARNLKLMHFDRSTADSCTFILKDNSSSGIVILIITVDDFLTITNNLTLLSQIKSQLATHYKLQHLGPVKHIIGWKVDRNYTQKTITISQPAYIRQVASIYNRTNCKPTHSPYQAQLPTKTEEHQPQLDGKVYPYQSLIGHLRYLADSTRPDISHITGVLGRFTHNPSMEHWHAAIRVVDYLQTYSHLGITYGKHEQMKAFSDSDYANCPSTLRSTTGYVITLNGGAISWGSKRQRRTAGSTWEAEFMAAYQTTRQVAVMRQLLHDMHIPQQSPTPLYIDNNAAVLTAKTPHPTNKSKQTKIEYQIINEHVQNQSIKPERISGLKNPADCLTKHQTKSKHHNCIQLLGLQPA